MAKAAKPATKRPLYSVHPGVAMVQKWIADLPKKTGKSLDQWVAFIQSDGPHDLKARRAWLKAEHGLGTNTAWWLAERADEGGMGMIEEDPATYLAAAEGYVAAMYSGGKAGLQPIYDRLLALGLNIGEDVKACPCKTIVPLYRNHVFAEIKPTTRTRIDLGFALKDAPIVGRLIDTGGFKKNETLP
ncbi:MAG: hypothetical protein JWN86_3311 [Planctomycetota bacterium]|nr:hypothetical protein [Planctomycetota bacterium]